MIVKLLAEQHLEFLSLKGGYTVLPESTLVKIPLCWKSHNMAQILFKNYVNVCTHGKCVIGHNKNCVLDKTLIRTCLDLSFSIRMPNRCCIIKLMVTKVLYATSFILLHAKDKKQRTKILQKKQTN